ncbi:ABC-type transport auxiliary lipoprotein family protein [Modicisalibacter sp. 'Wilcox']|uniref:PqiC family protein n=1 Tax=Modicisalibacter sp. 'Wilcox' TaxID=2679914 RepID=UPI0013D41E32|nr:ABC-type transport auxiliary lipoprotein family protein [Modicisalibacter sp. 'Wilcox']
MQVTKPLCLMLLGALLAGCASGGGPATERYLLPAGDTTTSSAVRGPAEHTLVIDDVRVARYLDDAGIVLQTDPLRLQAAGRHQWAEPLDRQLARTLRQRLSRALPGTRVLGGTGPDTAWHLSVEVEQFQGRYDGRAIAGGLWQLRDGQGELRRQSSFQASEVLEQDGYPALVKALGKSWNSVAEQIAEGLRRQWQAPEGTKGTEEKETTGEAAETG